MKTIRKNFVFEAKLIEKAAMRAAQSRRSLTKYIETLIAKDLKSHHDDFFNHIDK